MASLAENGDPTTSAARALQAPRFLAGSQKKAQKDEAKEAAKQWVLGFLVISGLHLLP